MKKHLLTMIIITVSLIVLPCICFAEVIGYSVQNNMGPAPKDVVVTIETTADVRSINLVDGSQSFITSSISQSNSNTGKIWTLTTFVPNTCNDEWTIYLKDSSGSWTSSDISFFVSIEGNSTSTSGRNVNRTWSTGSFSYAYAGTKDYSDNRINSHSGPDNSFMDSGSYKTRKITSLSAFYREKYGGVVWIYAEMHYQNGYKRRVYFKNTQIHYGDVPFVSFSQTPAYLTQRVTPTYGPAPDYDDFEDERYETVTLDANQAVSVLHEENDYFFIQFVYAGKECRAWVPVNTVNIK